VTDQPQGAALTAAHTSTETFHLEYEFPAHAPRETDSHYHLFHAACERIRRLGRWKCWIDNADCDKEAPLEAHHAVVEFSLSGDVDVQKFASLYPEFGVVDDETFLSFVESEGNLTILCPFHHRGIAGIHTVHYSAWLVQRFMRAGIRPPERKLVAAAAAVMEAAVPHIAEGASA
jgi:hypothetical protein